MFFIHQFNCISPQQTFPVADLDAFRGPVNNKLFAAEPAYADIPKGTLRRMSKAVRIGIGAAMPLIQQGSQPNGIIIGTANAGMEDCFLFLEQIISYNEGQLTPGNFVQSTPNALPAQLGMLSHNTGYNITHVHLGIAFENAAIDAAMLLADNPDHSYILGAVDDISAHNYNINLLQGWYKSEAISGTDLYDSDSAGCIPGEGTAMFRVSGVPGNAIAKMRAVETLHSTDELEVSLKLKDFLARHLPAGETIDLLISGENGDMRLQNYFLRCEEAVGPAATIARYKHMCGEFPTATATALWLGCQLIQNGSIPGHMLKRATTTSSWKNILIYNTFRGIQHSFLLLSTC